MNKITVNLKDNTLIVAGDLTQETVMSALATCSNLLPGKATIVVDFSAIEKCDSASLAFLTALLREGKAKETELRFTHLPVQMIQIGRVSGLEHILPLAES